MRLLAAAICLLASSPARAESLLEGRVAQIASEAGMAAAPPAPLALPGVPAPRGAVFPSESPWIGKSLDPALLSLDGAFTDRSKAEWQARVNANGGKAAIIPLAPIDPTRKLVVFIPGISLNLQNAHSIAALEGPYQVVIAVYNQRSTLEENSKELADALEALGRYRLALAATRGVAAQKELHLIGHSWGAISSEAALGQLAQKGLLGASGLFSKVLFICMAAPWRGFDAPPGLNSGPAQDAIKDLIDKVDPGWTRTTLLSVTNHTASMNDILKLRFPKEVTVRLVTPLPADGTGQNFHGFVEPLNSWYSIELAKGELERVWGFLKQPGEGTDKLDYGYGPLHWNQALQQLWLTLERCSLYPAHEPELRAAATQSSTLDQFKLRYDAVIGEIVDTFHGAHTDFMWNDSTFMPWLSKTLADWQGDAGT